ncbi:MAG TPA: ATP-binding protein, partial [Streptosporangiaceae bacterium]|nr:ATP-binding protein [Streptosporangiaceae bacterium]
HLLAELIENATTLSPPYTSVRVSGDTVGNGFAIEVEDRGLGISQHRLAELNERLANPPEFNPSDSEQLGLFVVGQLAKRHGIRVTLKASPYGGTEAVVLIPRQLIVADEGFVASLPGGTGPNAIIDGSLAENGVRPVAGELLSGGNGSYDGTFGASATLGDSPFPDPFPDAFPDPFPESSPANGGVPAFGSSSAFGDSAQFTAGPRISGPMRRSRGDGADSLPHGAHHAPRRERVTGPANGFPGNGSSGNGRGDGFDRTAGGIAGSTPFSGPPFGSSMAGGATADDGLADDLPKRNRGRSGAAAAPDPAGAADSFDVFKPRSRGEEPPPYAGPAAGMQTGESGEPADGFGQAEGEHEGLPRRVRQASLAPQLRSDPAFRQRQAAAAAGQGAGAPESGGPSPEEIRATMSALQRGWQEGRSQSATEGEPPWRTASEGE